MEELVFFYPEGHEAHHEYGHPERPERIETIRSALVRSDLWEPFPHLEPAPVSSQALGRVHSSSYLAALQAACEQGQRLDPDTYTTPASWQLALNAAGGAVAIAEAVWQGNARRGFALTRPPGHHATIDRGMGFCLMNNVALAAEALVQQEGARRLAIVDLDLHHGNGTQDIFWKRGDVLYISTHQYPFYPGSGRLEDRGSGEGYQATANLPLPPHSGDQAFRAAMDEIILPLLARFNPEMILVSAGFDTHWRDPLGSLLLSAERMGGLVASLAGWADQHCNGRIALFLEGGYDLEAGAACVVASTQALLGKPCSDPLGPSPEPESPSWQAIIRQARQIWEL